MRDLELVAAIALAACGPRVDKPGAAEPRPQMGSAAMVARNPAEDARRARNTAVRRAEQALDDDSPLDYERPFVDKPIDRASTFGLLVDACRAGHKPSCWKALTIGGDKARPETVTFVAQNCRAGDKLSCRALPSDHGSTLRFPELPGALGRSGACEDGGDDCDIAALEKECEAAFVRSCDQARLLSRDENARDQLLARVVELGTQGCDAGLFDDCVAIAGKVGPEQQFEVDRQRCRLERRECRFLAQLMEKQGRSSDARDELERSCQYGGPVSCLSLGVAYLDHKYPEPVPGRGQALIDHDCEFLRSRSLPDIDLVARTPECKRATKSK